MKKLFLFGFCLFVVSSVFAVTQTKFSTPDEIAAKKAIIKSKYKGESSKPFKKAEGDTLLKLLEADVASFADMVKICDECFHVNNVKKGQLKYSTLLTPLTTWGYPNSFIKEGYNFYKSNKLYGSAVWLIVRCSTEKLGFTDAQLVNEIEFIFDSSYLQKANASKDAMIINKLISKYLDATRKAGTDDAHVKSTLKKLNRIFTEKLVSDKTTWELVVAKIRSILEIY